MVLVLAAVLAAAGCKPRQQPAVPAVPLPPEASVATPAPASPSQPKPRFFVGEWAANLSMCRDPWRITETRLSTPGEVGCRFDKVTETRPGFDVAAVCTAEAPEMPYTLHFAYAESARALLVSGGPFKDIGLVRCGEGLPPVLPPDPGQPGGLPDDRTPISEAPFRPESAQGAANVVQTYYALIGEKKYRDARSLWSDGGRASGKSAEAFERELSTYQSYNAQIGAPGRIEGAAGSLYVEVPVVIYGRRASGEELHEKGTVTLRRVNDVPGSTPEQRRWHIAGIELSPSPGPVSREGDGRRQGPLRQDGGSRHR